MKKYFTIVFSISIVISMLILISQASAAETRVLQPRFGYVLEMTYEGIEPSPVAPGSTATMTFMMKNTAIEFIKDIRIDIDLPEELAPFNDITQRRISLIGAGESREINFEVIALPSAQEGIYNITLDVFYLNSIGYGRLDNGTVSVMIGGTPDIFVIIDSSEVYKGKNVGEVSILLVNNELADVRFLTVELQPSEDYDIIGASKEYVGDLDSDDFETVDFRLKIKTKKESVRLPLSLSYRDALNREYSEEISLDLIMQSPEEIGIARDNTIVIIVVIIVVGIVAYILYRKYKKKNVG